MIKKEKEFQEEAALTREEEEFLTLELQEEEEGPAPRFTFRQKLILIGTGLFSFLIFTVWLFPLDEVVRSSLQSSSAKTGTIINFRDLSISILGNVTLDTLEITTSSNLKIKTEEAVLKTSLLGLIKKKFNGKFKLISLKIDTENGPLAKIRSFEGQGKFDNLDQGFSRMNGTLDLEIPAGSSSGMIQELPEIPLLGELKNITIKKFLTKLNLQGGNLIFNDFTLDTSIARFDITGNIRLSENMSFSQLNLRICLELDRNFELERQDIQDMLTLLEKQSGSKCIPVMGTVNKPEVKIPGISGSLAPGNP
ncbi:type II secretion system protein GspN [Leptospira borgpetersenii]|uniref:type II secretion system protein GspN n=1 Tax=Leptospira borgpetersenii TaxID=174 RepID=UPI0007739EB8|nr:type II secretion system protein GspN [Leptospira borgpetersenii]MBE8401424.1 type II secretion system protein GspN [Leptospira borgpetersenii serovar Tarassovi]MBE8404430.1 type II secretion system protein GspN [Leptospira borgpetersenii serovar Tarassovi]MBE8407583.1 type II secretion system protein GspN [Leptospira borgpetersenii serovar Tarassovi]MBE8413860.1 type II secretion system protein GspN [Leptospira borgpetersenii serovar Tarassovi]MBE8416256.1 type II secretion system protein 